MFNIRSTIKLAVITGLPVMALVLGGCARGDERPGLAPVPDGLDPRPNLESIPRESVRVAVFQGGADVSYDLVEGQRYFLVNESSDTLLTSGVAERDGQVTIGEDGAEFRGRTIWEGSVDAASQIGLYVNRQLEEL